MDKMVEINSHETCYWNQIKTNQILIATMYLLYIVNGSRYYGEAFKRVKHDMRSFVINIIVVQTCQGYNYRDRDLNIFHHLNIQSCVKSSKN